MSVVYKCVVGVFAAALLVVSGCGAGSTSSPPAAVVTPATRSTPTQSPSAVAPAAVATKAEDLAAAKRALVTAAVLGRPWVQPKKVNTTGGKADEACPGTPALTTLAPLRVNVVAAFTHGKAVGASIARFSVATVSEGGGDAYRKGWQRTSRGCATFRDGAGFYVVTSLQGPTSIRGADDVLSRAERLYYDPRHKKLAYARHVLSARRGRAISTVEYSFLTSTADPQAKSFAVALQLLNAQLTRTTAAFAE